VCFAFGWLAEISYPRSYLATLPSKGRVPVTVAISLLTEARRLSETLSFEERDRPGTNVNGAGIGESPRDRRKPQGEEKGPGRGD